MSWLREPPFRIADWPNLDVPMLKVEVPELVAIARDSQQRQVRSAIDRYLRARVPHSGNIAENITIPE
jgi:hypothetical protein